MSSIGLFEVDVRRTDDEVEFKSYRFNVYRYLATLFVGKLVALIS